MHITIGEVINEIQYYTNLIEVKLINDIPYVKAYLIDHNGFVVSYVYIAQTSEGVYSAAETSDDLYGRYVVINNINHPLILEKNLIKKCYKAKDNNIHEDMDIVCFTDYFNNILIRHKMLMIPQSRFNSPITDFHFSTTRIPKNLKVICNRFGFDPSIRNIALIVKDRDNKFDLSNMKEKDINEMKQKFHDMGVIINIQGKIIADIYFESRYRDIEKKKYSIKI